MKLYLSVIGIAAAIISGVNIACGVATWHYVVIAVIWCVALEFAIDGGEYQPRTELLRANNICRVQLGMQPHKLGIMQPWVFGKEKIEHTVSTRFTVRCDVPVSNAHLALETDECTVIRLNGKDVPVAPDGWYTDRAIVTIPLPDLQAAENVIEITQGLGETTCMEWCYILGDFGVALDGNDAHIIQKPTALTYGDLAEQGLPFFGGIVAYECPIETGGGKLGLTLPAFKGTFARILIDGKDAGMTAYPPYHTEIDGVPAGKHTLTVEICIPRANAFGPVHHFKGSGMHAGPAAWRTEGDKWSDDYLLTVQGLLKAPVVKEWKN